MRLFQGEQNVRSGVGPDLGIRRQIWCGDRPKDELASSIVTRPVSSSRARAVSVPGVPDASTVHKGKRKVTDADGQVECREIKHHGYKTHVSLDTQTRLVTSLTTTSGKDSDGVQMQRLMALDKAVGVPAEIYTADRAYDHGENHQALEDAKKGDAIKELAIRTEKKDSNKQKWIAKQAAPEYQEGLRQRHRIEAKFGEAKAWHGFGRCRYRGRAGHIAQAFLTFLVLNLKRIIWLATGVTFRNNGRRRSRLSWA